MPDAIPYKVSVVTTEQEIPPGKRKPRDVERTNEYTGFIRTCTADEAPVALHLITENRFREEKKSFDYRWFNGRLYSRVMEDSTPPVPAVFDFDSFERRTRQTFEEWTRRKEDWSDEQLLVNGEWWEVTTEPCYELAYDTRGYIVIDIATRAKVNSEGAFMSPNVFPVSQLRQVMREARFVFRLVHPAMAFHVRALVKVLIPEAIRFLPFTPSPYSESRDRPLSMLDEAKAALRAIPAEDANVDYRIKGAVSDALDRRTEWFVENIPLGQYVGRRM